MQKFKNNLISIKCNDCGSINCKKRKNYSHGNSSKAKVSYICNDCNSSNIEISSNRRNFRR